MKKIFALFLLTLTVNCFSQTVSINSKQTPANLLLQIRYDGQPLPVAAISIKVRYDTTIFRMDSARMNTTLVQGWGYGTTPAYVNTCNFALSWFNTDPNDTLMLHNGVIFNVWLHKKQAGCSNFTFLDGGNNELTGLDYLPLSVDWIDSYICNNSIQSKV